MTDTITLPRATVQQALGAIDLYQRNEHCEDELLIAGHFLRTALEQQQAEPVAWMVVNDAGEDELWWHNGSGNGKPLYTTPPQRKPLTDEMRKQMKEASDSIEMRGAFANGWLSAEAAHGIKEGT